MKSSHSVITGDIIRVSQCSQVNENRNWRSFYCDIGTNYS